MISVHFTYIWAKILSEWFHVIYASLKKIHKHTVWIENVFSTYIELASKLISHKILKKRCMSNNEIFRFSVKLVLPWTVIFAQNHWFESLEPQNPQNWFHVKFFWRKYPCLPKIETKSVTVWKFRDISSLINQFHEIFQFLSWQHCIGGMAQSLLASPQQPRSNWGRYSGGARLLKPRTASD